MTIATLRMPDEPLSMNEVDYGAEGARASLNVTIRMNRHRYNRRIE